MLALAAGVLLAVVAAGPPDQALADHCKRDRDGGNGTTVVDPGPIDGAAVAQAASHCPHDDDDEDEEEPELEVSQTLSPDPPRLGEPLTYFVTVVNDGSVTASGVQLVVQLPDGVELRSTQPAGGCTANGAWLTCPLGSLGDGQATSLQITVVPRRGGTLVSQASASADDADGASTSLAAVIGEGGPVLGQSFVASLISGIVLVREPGSTTFRQLLAGELLPLGSVVDARRGRVRVVSALDAQGNVQSADFFSGMFQVTQSTAEQAQSSQAGGPAPVTELRLVGGNFAVCRPGASSSAAGAGTSPAARSAQVRRPVRRLWGSGRGRFRTTGRYGSAAVRGTLWLVVDRCDGTLVVAREGSVSVFDRVRRRTVVLTAGRSHLVRAPGRSRR